MINCLIIGSGGREHALAWKLKQSPQLGTLHCAPGNPGMAALAICVDLAFIDAPTVIDFCRQHTIGLVVIGPEQPLIDGLADHLRAAGIVCFGPSAQAAQLEGSKGFTKDLCAKYHIPTAAYQRFSDATAAKAYVTAQGAPIVIKADGLAAGKGVVVASSVAEAHVAIDSIMSTSGAALVVEACMVGEEASFFVLCDGTHVLPLAAAQDHKRVGDGDTGPNTGGMGAYSPAPVITPALIERTMDEIILPTVRAMAAERIPFIGVLFAGLMITADGPQLIEYNCRFGDPETQVLMLRMTSDLLPLLLAAATGTLDQHEVQWSQDVALTVVMAARGYPGPPLRGSEIRGLEALATDPDIVVFHAGTTRDGARLLANGGRVLNVTARAATVAAARQKVYAAIDKIEWPEGFCRRDIGWRAIGGNKPDVAGNQRNRGA